MGDIWHGHGPQPNHGGQRPALIKWLILPFFTPRPFSNTLIHPHSAQTMPRELKKRKRNASSAERIPRPPNCFLIFRADWLRNSTANSTPGSLGRRQQKHVSLEAATAWNDLSPVLKQLYQLQADIIKDEHSKLYPGWVYRPRAGKGKSGVADDATQDGSATKPVARRRRTAPHEKREATATPSTKATAPAESVWEGAWFSGSSSMRDPFYSAPLQPLASVSVLENP